MTYRLITASILLAGLAACSSGPKTAEDKQNWAVADTKVAVKHRLRDPDSAEFSNVHAVSYEGKLVVCGYVNAANGFGGKSGLQRFVGAGEVVFLEEDGVSAVTEAWDKFGC